MKKIFLMLLALLACHCLNANHWQPNPYQFQYNMISIGVVVIDGIEQSVDSLEVGAFRNGECRGSAMTTYNESYDRYYVFMMLYGNDGDSLDFKVYDHLSDEELDLISLSVIVFEGNGMIGNASEPFVFAFENNLPPIQEYEVSVAVNPEESGAVSGDGIYQEGEICTVSVTPNEHWFFESWTVGSEVVSTNAEYSFAVTDDVTLTANLYYYNKVSENAAASFEVYPNPTSDYLIINNVTCEKSELAIYDINGRMVCSKTLTDNKTVVDTRDFAAGEYFVVIGNAARKIVKN